MSLVGALMVIGCLLAIVLFFIYYIFPNFICETTKGGSNFHAGNLKDPLSEVCKVAK
jgi:hypothetical protein